MCLPFPLHLEPGEDHFIEVRVSNQVISEEEGKFDLLNQQGVVPVEDLEDWVIEEMVEKVEQWAVYLPLHAIYVEDSILENAGDHEWLCVTTVADLDTSSEIVQWEEMLRDLRCWGKVVREKIPSKLVEEENMEEGVKLVLSHWRE